MTKIMFSQSWHRESIKENGLKEGDEVILFPFNERKRKITLNRKKFIFSSKRSDDLPWVFKLDSFERAKFEYEMILSSTGYYFFKSTKAIPFRLNGNLCFSALIEKGDTIEFGLNELKFPRKVEKAIELLDKKILQGQIPILIEGETGTGKTHLAHKVHKESQRKGPFVHVNLSSFSQNLFESELFGHTKGSFTGAINDKKGALREAHQGTLFIDEIDSLPKELQVKLLLFLDSKKVRSVGSCLEKKIDTRLIFASGRILDTLVAQNMMRQDFFFRLNTGVKIWLSPLREDRKKIRELIEQFEEKEDVVFSYQLKKFYELQKWPGNIRQLNAHLYLKKELSHFRRIEFDYYDEKLCQFNINIQDENEQFIDMKTLKENYLKYIYLKTDGQIKKGARILKISPTTFREVIKNVI